MTDSLQLLQQTWHATSYLEIIAVVFGVLYIVLAVRQHIGCWLAALISTGVSIYLFWDGRLLMESALNGYYLIMAVYGWWQWQYGGTQNTALPISSWSRSQHLIALTVIAVLTLGSGYLLAQNTVAALPYLDSFTTWSAVITTWMVARKILENWLYWLVINSASIYLYIDRGFLLYAVLYVIYIVIAVAGYRAWRRSYRHQYA